MAAVIRPWREADVAPLTELLHRAYAPLAAAGMNFTAVDQTIEVTRARLASGHGLVAEGEGGALLGTVLVAGALDPNVHPGGRATPWYQRDDVAHVHQYAVAPEAQGRGLGSALMAAAEAWALERGLRAMALDTAEPATHLQRRYERGGYRLRGHCQWPGKVYRSVVMVKPLGDRPEPGVEDAAHRVAVVRGVAACIQARDWQLLRQRLHDHAVMHWPASGEWFDDAEAIVRVQALYPEGWRLWLREATALADGRVHAALQVDHGDRRFFAHGLWRIEAERVAFVEETWATAEPPPAWRSAHTLGAYRCETSPWSGPPLAAGGA